MGIVTLDRRIKPAPWNFDPERVDPAWRAICRGLIFAVPYWEGGGAPRDYISRAYGVPRNTIDPAPTWESARLGRERNYEHNSAVISRGTADDWGAILGQTLTDPFTVLSLFRLEGGHTNINTLVSLGDADGDTGHGWYLSVNSFNTDSRAIRFDLEGTTLLSAVSATGAVVTDKYHVAVGRRAAGAIDVWLDGTLRGSASGSRTLTTTGKLFLGGMQKGTDAGEPTSVAFGLDGAELAVLIWNRVLSDAEVVRVSADPFGPFRQARRVWARVPAAGGDVRRVPSRNVSQAVNRSYTY